MAEDEDRSSIEARLRSALDSLDQFSKRTSDSIASRMNRKEKAPSDKTVQERTAEMMDRARDGIVRFNTGVSERIQGAQIRSKASKAKGMSLAAFRRVGLLLSGLLSYSPYLIPAIILLQSSIWIGILSEGTLSNSLVSDLEVGMGESARNAWLVDLNRRGLASIPSDDEFRYRHAAPGRDILVIQFRHHLRASARIVGDVPPEEQEIVVLPRLGIWRVNSPPSDNNGGRGPQPPDDIALLNVPHRHILRTLLPL